MNLGGFTLSAGLFWLIAAAVLAIGELAAPGVFLIFVAIAAALTGVGTLVFSDMPVIAQVALFAVWSAVAVMVGRHWYREYPVATSDPLLNDRAARMIGAVAVVEEAIVAGSGRVRIGDGAWPARGGDAAVGTRLRVAEIIDGIAIVEPVERVSHPS